jgi:hypothetical protein
MSMSPTTILSLVKLIMRLAPALRAAIVELIHAIVDGDAAAERLALEAARRAALIARQRK